jgi:TonB family protein
MKTQRKRVAAVVAAAMLAAGLVATAMVGCAGEQEARPEAAAPATALRQTRSPTLTVDGKENPDVYLRGLDIQVEVTGNIASTRHTMTFRNMTDRVLESTLTFPLPEGRTVTYYALDIDGKMREAVPVEKARGTTVFEEIERRKVDPGLLERVEGNNFRTRIYPIPAYGTRTVAIGYEEELELENGALRYNLPLDYPGAITEFAVKAAVWRSDQKPKSDSWLRFEAEGEGYAASFTKGNYRPPRALSFSLPMPADAPRVLMQPAQGSYYFLATVAPNLKKRKTQWGNELTIIWDVSLSGLERDIRRELDLLGTVFAEKKKAYVRLYFLNNKLNKTGEAYKVINGKWDGLKKALAAAAFDGGTDFSQIDLDSIAGDEILFFSDGISTLGDADFLSGDSAKTKRPIHCVVSSPNADYGAMKSIAARTNGKFINVNALSPERLKSELLYETPLFLGAEHGQTVREAYPGVVTPFYGDFSVAGISDAREAELTLLFGYGDSVEKRVTVKLDARNAWEHDNVHKIWAQKKIAELDLDYENKYEELTELGRQFGIITRSTSLIVLETRADYARYGIPPPPDLRDAPRPKNAFDSDDGGRIGYGSGFGGGVDDLLSGLMTGGSPTTSRFFVPRRSGSGFGSRVGAVEREPMREERGAQIERPVSSNKGGGDPRARVTDIGVLGIVSDQVKGKTVASADIFGKGGFATDIDAILREKDARDQVLRKKAINVSSPDFLTGGSLLGGRSRASIQRVVMRNMAALRNNYNKRLREKPELAGKITVKFAIDEFGKVLFAQVLESTMNDAELETAVVAGVKSLRFEEMDKPGDVTEVTYPFIFIDSDMPVATAAPRKAEYRAGDPAMLAMAVVAANRLREWWNIEFSPAAREPQPQPKYPVPDRKGRTPGEIGAGTGHNAGGAYMKGLTGKTADDYKTYLKVRADYIGEPAFYFDMADWFYARGDKETALRVLTSIAELELENASLYRLLGYRFKEYEEHALEKFACKKVVQWRPFEPHSHRDYALALAGNGEAQAALDTLCSLLEKKYTANIIDRSRGIVEAVVADINRLIAQNPDLDTSKVDGRLRADLAADLRVVLNWNMNDADIDLRVLDPTGEECYFRNRTTRIGGRLSGDAREGYGPEQFMLKNALKGRYAVYAHYYGDEHKTASAGPSTVMADIYTYTGGKKGGKAERRMAVCKQLFIMEWKETGAMVAEIVVE